MPIAATTQSVAAVVRPRTARPCRMIAPAPRKPIPVTICAAIRVGSARTTAAPEARKAWNPYAETIVKRADPSATSRCVRRPASRSRSSRSTPIRPPSMAASASRRSDSSQLSVGRLLDASCSNGFFLGRGDLVDASGGKLQQLVQMRAAERRALRRRLYLDERTLAGHHHVHVHLCLRVLGVVEIEQRLAADDPDRNGGDRSAEGASEAEAVERAPGGDVGARDGGAPRAAVRLQDVAVDPKRPLTERFEVGDGA